MWRMNPSPLDKNKTKGSADSSDIQAFMMVTERAFK
jgi:hypothetical protein